MPRLRILSRRVVLRSERGVVLLTTLILMTLLAAIGGSGTIRSRVDLFISHNLRSGVQAFWLAQAGAEVGKNWLEAHLPGETFPMTLGPQALGEGTYTVRIEEIDARRYRITATGAGSEASRRVIEEVVSLPPFTPFGVVTSLDAGLQPDFTDPTTSPAGSGHRIPDFSIDGRNHALAGGLSPRCPDIAPFAVHQIRAQTDLINAQNSLKQRIVTRANRFCRADGGSTAFGVCTPGLAWVRGPTLLPRFAPQPCRPEEQACFLHLDLSAAVLRATAQPAHVHLPAAPDDRGPFTPGSATTPFAYLLAAEEQSQLQTALVEIQQQTARLPLEQVLEISHSIGRGSHTYGTGAQPRVTQIQDGHGLLRIHDGARVQGFGLLIIPRVVLLSNVTFQWQGIVVIVDDGDLRAEGPNVCGQILGAVLVQDGGTLGRKLDFDRVKRTGTCAPLAVNYSCEAVTRALVLLQRTVSWTEQFDV